MRSKRLEEHEAEADDSNRCWPVSVRIPNGKKRKFKCKKETQHNHRAHSLIQLFKRISIKIQAISINVCDIWLFSV